MGNWNVLIRWDGEPHFKPIWSTGTDERNARREYAYMGTDSYYDNAELQLVTDYSSRWEQTKLVITGWIGVPV